LKIEIETRDYKTTWIINKKRVLPKKYRVESMLEKYAWCYDDAQNKNRQKLTRDFSGSLQSPSETCTILIVH
jgi:hypothetical protein